MSKFWQIKNISDSEGELLLYGEIMDERPWWDWDGSSNVTTPKEFLEDLKQLDGKSKIIVRINSVGGDVFAAHAIYTQLKTRTATKEVIVDGLAASAATIVAMAGDTVKMPANAMLMIHNPSVVVWDSFTAEDLEKLADSLNAVKESIIEAYVAKTKLDRKELSKMMDKETWLTGREAKEKGFADEIMFEDTTELPTVSNDGKYLFINSIKHDVSRFKNKPHMQTSQRHSQPPAPGPQSAVNNTIPKKEGVEPMFKDVNELRNACPELVKQIEDAAREEGKKQERGRIQDIEKIAKTIDPTLVNKAKFETPMDAKELAFNALQADGQKGQRYLDDAEEDANASGTKEVGAASSDAKPGDDKPKTIQDKVKNIAAGFDARRRGVAK